MDLPSFLVKNEDGEICLRGHRIRLIDIADRYDEGHLPEAIATDEYPTLSLTLVYKAIAFFLENETEIRKLMEDQADAMRRLIQANPQVTPSLAELRRRIDSRRQAEAG